MRDYVNALLRCGGAVEHASISAEGKELWVTLSTGAAQVWTVPREGRSLAILSAIQRLSFKDGIGPFIDQVSSLMGAAMPMPRELEEKVAKTYSDTVKKLRSQSSASLQTDTQNLAHGPVPLGSSRHGAN